MWLQPATTVMLADAMELVREFSECTTSHPAIMVTPVNPGINNNNFNREEGSGNQFLTSN
jgi:hypothetical protein